MIRKNEGSEKTFNYFETSKIQEQVLKFITKYISKVKMSKIYSFCKKQLSDYILHSVGRI